MGKRKEAKIGDIVEVEFLDHEIGEGLSEDDLQKEEDAIKPTKLYGLFVKDTEGYLVIAYWVEDKKKDVARILKKDILNVRVLK
jgi:hypothetical protein